jgi:hypothetical protein
LTLLEAAVVELNIVDRASDDTIGRTLKKALLSLTSRSNGSSRRMPTTAFVASMEDVLEVYQRPHDPDRPVVCLDETTKQLIKETRSRAALR